MFISEGQISNRSRDTRIRIINAAEKLFRQFTYAGFRMKHLSDHIGITRKTLYNHFPGGKRDIWRACVERQMRDFAGRLSRIVNDRKTDYVDRGGLILDIGREAVEQFYGPEGLISSGEEHDYFFPELKKSYVMNLTRFFEEGVQNGLLRKNLPVRSLSEVMMSLITAWGQPDSTMMEGELKSLPEFVEMVMFTGMLSDEGRRQTERLHPRKTGRGGK